MRKLYIFRSIGLMVSVFTLLSVNAINYVPKAGMTAIATSSAGGNYGPTSAIDGDVNTMWHVNWSPLPVLIDDANPQSITISLGSSYFVNALEYLPRQDGSTAGQILNYNLYTSTDGNNWTLATSGTWSVIASPSASPQFVSFNGINASYVKLEATSTYLSTALTASEISIQYTDPNIISHTMMTATASSQQTGGFEASMAIDDNPSTMWHVNWDTQLPLPQSITLNLNNTYNTQQLDYLPRQDVSLNGNITNYNIYVSMDGVNFGTPVATGNWAADASLKSALFTGNANYVKLEATAGVGGWVAAAEINLVGVQIAAPSAPTSVVVTAGNTKASIAFTASASNGGSAILDYTVTSSPGSLTSTGATSPITVTGLTNGTAYTFTVTARNAAGSSAGGTSSAVTPHATNNNIAVSSATNTSALTLTPVSDVVVDNDALLTINQATTINSLTVEAGGMVTNSSTITTPTLTINSHATNGTGTYINNGTSNITTLIASQYLGTTRNWYVSSPVVSTASSATNISQYYEYVEAGSNVDFSVAGSTAYWKGYNAGHTMLAGKGYIALPSASGAAVAFNGTMNTGEVTIALSKSGNGFNLIGNPYPAHLTWTKTFVDSKAAQIEPTIWYRTNAGSVNSGGDAAWSYKTINASTGEASPLGTTNNIPPMQAFWVKALAAGNLILNSDLTKSHQSSNLLKAPAAIKTDRQRVRLEVSNGTTTDETLIYFDAAALDTYDRYDSPKYAEASTVTQIFTTIGTEKLVINGMNEMPFNKGIALDFTPGNASLFTIKANELTNIPTGVKVILKDNVTLTETDLTDGVSAYQFEPKVSATDRFSLIFRAPGVATGIDNGTKLNAQVFVNAANRITIIAPEKSNYAIYNAMGQLISDGVTTSNFQTSIPIAIGIKLAEGVYIVKVNNELTKVIMK